MPNTKRRKRKNKNNFFGLQFNSDPKANMNSFNMMMGEDNKKDKSLPYKLREDDNINLALDTMSKSNASQDDAYIGPFWYDPNKNEVYGNVMTLASDKPFYSSKGKKIRTGNALHKNIWQKESRRNKDPRFQGDYKLKPRGRVFEYEDDGFVVYVGNWIKQYPEAKEEILDVFQLPKSTKFVIDEHWDIGHGWSEEIYLESESNNMEENKVVSIFDMFNSDDCAGWIFHTGDKCWGGNSNDLGLGDYFPLEDEEDFTDTMRIEEKIPLDNGLFIYYGTWANDLTADDIPEDEITTKEELINFIKGAWGLNESYDNQDYYPNHLRDADYEEDHDYELDYLRNRDEDGLNNDYDFDDEEKSLGWLVTFRNKDDDSLFDAEKFETRSEAYDYTRELYNSDYFDENPDVYISVEEVDPKGSYGESLEEDFVIQSIDNILNQDYDDSELNEIRDITSEKGKRLLALLGRNDDIDKEVKISLGVNGLKNGKDYEYDWHSGWGKVSFLKDKKIADKIFDDTRKVIKDKLNSALAEGSHLDIDREDLDLLNIHEKHYYENLNESDEDLDKFVGKTGRFNPSSLYPEYWDVDDEEMEKIENHSGKRFTITGVSVDNFEFDDSYFNIKFDDGYEMDGVSGYELKLFDNQFDEKLNKTAKVKTKGGDELEITLGDIEIKDLNKSKDEMGKYYVELSNYDYTREQAYEDCQKYNLTLKVVGPAERGGEKSNFEKAAYLIGKKKDLKRMLKDTDNLEFVDQIENLNESFNDEFVDSLKTSQDKVNAFIKKYNLVADDYNGKLDIHTKPNKFGATSIALYDPKSNNLQFVNDDRYDELGIDILSLQENLKEAIDKKFYNINKDGLFSHSPFFFDLIDYCEQNDIWVDWKENKDKQGNFRLTRFKIELDNEQKEDLLKEFPKLKSELRAERKR